MAYLRCLIMRNKPRIRFKGFTEDWEQRKLGEIFKYLQNNTLSRDSLNYKNPNIKNIHYGDILVKFDEVLDGSNKEIPYINSELDLSKFSNSLLNDGDVIFSDTAEDDTVGKAIELQNVSAPYILSGLHTVPCRPLIPFGRGYLGNFLNSDSYRLQLRPLVQGIKVSSISKSALKDTVIEYPRNLKEQEKIGYLFYVITKMITLRQRKLEKLKLAKKALLQKLFPKNGSQYPEVRFKGFNDDWKFYKLDELLCERSVLRPQSDKYPLVSFTSENGVTPKTERYNREALVIGDKANKKYKVTILDDIVYNPANLKFGAIARNKYGNAVFSPIYITLEVDFNQVIPSFIEYILTSNSFINKALRYQQGTVYERQSVNVDSFLLQTIRAPRLSEQVKIKDLFVSLDCLASLHQRKLDKLKEVKKGLLQKMFV